MDETSLTTRPSAAAPGIRASDAERPVPGIRASDAEREQIAARIREAAGEGRLTLAELEERLSTAYAARMRHELDELVVDLPASTPPAEAPRRTGPMPRQLDRFDLAALGVHAVLILGFAVALLVRWASHGMMFFWPLFPILWALVSLAVHVRIRRYAQPWWRPGPKD